jgi:hypothetical protein
METGTQIILQRMIDCPEEFPNEGEYHGKWTRIISEAKNILPTEDVEALDVAYKQLLVDRYNERVLKTLAGEGEPESNLIYKSKNTVALQDHAAQHQKMVREREVQIQRDMRAAQSASAYPTAGLQNSLLGGLWK